MYSYRVCRLKPVQHLCRWAGAVGVDCNRIGLAPQFVQLLGGDEHVEQPFQHHQGAGSVR